ncbi:MAG: hypothetical protein GY835_01000 [bacterium]|nr:hypothetical protein [bacterium]
MKIVIICLSLALLIPAADVGAVPLTWADALALLDSERPGDTARVFAPGRISTSTDDWALTFSPDGDEIYYTVTGRSRPAIASLKLEGDRWRGPEIVPFSGRYSDMMPVISADGQHLIFVSYRPTGPQDDQRDAGIWRVSRQGDGWGEPHLLPGAVNREGEHETWPTLAANGDLYFAMNREDSQGDFDLYVSHLVDGLYTEPENLGAPVNTALGEYCPLIHPNGDWLIFEVVDGPGGLGKGDMWIAEHESDGSWSAPRNLGQAFNSRAHDCNPRLSPDGSLLFFQSERRVRLSREDVCLTYGEILQQSRQSGGWDIYWIGIEALAPFLTD